MDKSAVEADTHALYRDHHGWLLGWLRRKLDGADVASDLAQDTFVRVLRRGHARRMPALREPRAYLTRIAQGLLVDHWRRSDLEQAWLQTLAALPEQHAPSPETRQIVLEALVRIDAALDTLKPAARSAFLMAQIDGLSCPQIAARLGVSLATAERYLAAGLRRCYALRFHE